MAGRERLLEREHELAAIEEGIASACGGDGRALLVEGQPGLGKTRLAWAAAERAGEREMLVLRARAAELEQELGWGVVRTLFGPVLTGPARREALLQGAARAAEPIFGGHQPEATGSAVDPILHGLYWMISDLAAERPVLIVVDDMHWADGPSARWLAHFCARIEDLPVLALLTARPVRASRYWQAIGAARSARLLPLTPLTEAGTQAVVAEQLGAGNDELASACHEATGGNPFLVGELLRYASRNPDGLPSPEHVSALRPDSIRRSVLLRLAELGAEATQLCFAIAILGREATVALTAELAGIERDHAVRAADALESADVIRIGERLDFVHPLVLDIVREEIPPAQLAEWHRNAAELLAARGAGPGQLATHLLATDGYGRAEVVQTLRAAAAEAFAVGGADIAAAYLRRALSEPPTPDQRGEVLTELARAEAAEDPTVAIRRYREALAITPDPLARARIAYELAGSLLVRGDIAEAVRVCEDAKVEAAGGDRELDLQLGAIGLTAATLDVTNPPKPPDFLESLAGATPGERLMLVSGINALIANGRTPMPVVGSLAFRALDGGALVEEIAVSNPMFWAAATTLVLAERYEEASGAIGSALSTSQRKGSRSGFALASSFLSDLRRRFGELPAAIADARQALAVIDPGVDPMLHAYALAFLLAALVDAGALEAAEDEVLALQLEDAPPLVAFALLIGARGRLHAARGRWREAADDLLAAGERLGRVSPALFPWRSEAAIALHQLGDCERACRLAATEVELAERHQTQWALAAALRSLALASGSLEPLERAEELTRDKPIRLERARVLTALGAALRRNGRTREAGTWLTQALDLADRCGATPLASRAREELQVATGARPRRSRISGPEALTPSERRVCEMAAAGQTNREIAQALFVSLRTIETHLTRAYLKLDVSSRSDLPAALQGSSSSSPEGSSSDT
jgi:DNA-binding CsgD family transcriptional regulator